MIVSSCQKKSTASSEVLEARAIETSAAFQIACFLLLFCLMYTADALTKHIRLLLQCAYNWDVLLHHNIVHSLYIVLCIVPILISQLYTRHKKMWY